MDNKQHRSCLTAFRNVMFMVKDPNDKVYKEADANYQICSYHNRDRF